MAVEEFWKPFEVEIEDFEGLLTVINQIMEKVVSKNIKFAWRGQIDASWPLHSSLYRRMNLTKGKILAEEDITKEEHDILAELHRWGLHSSSQTGRLSILNQLAMLQHYGVPTRLIDITFNAWVGVWFAVEEKWSNGERVHEDKDARLFAFDVTDRLINESEHYRSWEDNLSRPWKTDIDDCIDKKEWTTSVLNCIPSYSGLNNLSLYQALIERYEFIEHLRADKLPNNERTFAVLDGYSYAFGGNTYLDKKCEEIINHLILSMMIN